MLKTSSMVYKSLVVGVIVLFVGICINPSIAIYNIKKSSISVSYGNTLYVGGTGEGNYTKIQDAIDNASDGDTVFVYNGTYYENIIIGISINLVGEDRDTTVINASNIVEVDAIYITANYCNISDFSLIGGPSATGYSGIDIKSDFNTIKECNMIDSWGSGIYLDGSNNLIYDNLIARNGWYGIWVHWADNNIVTNNIIRYNIISSNKDGIALDSFEGGGAYNNLIYSNNFINNRRYNARDDWINTWDNGYPIGGNYWSDYTGVDNFSGPNQDIPGSDGIGDTPYNIPNDNVDRYPLIKPWDGNHHPETPVIDGPASGKQDIEYCFLFHSTDLDNDSVKYIINWGDGTTNETDFTQPCTPVEVCHTWEKMGIYIIRVKAIDEFGAESEWSDPFQIEIPRNRVISSLFTRLVEQYPILEVFLRAMNLLR